MTRSLSSLDETGVSENRQPFRDSLLDGMPQGPRAFLLVQEAKLTQSVIKQNEEIRIVHLDDGRLLWLEIWDNRHRFSARRWPDALRRRWRLTSA
jgi:hypothetical protein